jgi:outer membrane lipoprotein-sorting protein
MSQRRTIAAIFLICLLSTGLSSCLARRRAITRKGSPSQKLLIADQTSLIESVARHYNAIQDFSATVDMTPALGSAEKSQITEYKDVRAYIYFHKPSSIHIVGLYPVVRSRAFDMVSSGDQFKLYIPSRNLFIVGRNQIETPSANKLENLRPQHFIDALLVRPIDPNAEKVFLENFTDEDNAFYILHEVHDQEGKLHIDRTVWFSRLDLEISREIIFDAQGNILTDARYSQWHGYDNVPFPKHVEINRPRDEYGVVIDVVKMDINKGVSDDKFVLPQPEGSTLKTAGQPSPSAPAPIPQGKKK